MDISPFKRKISRNIDFQAIKVAFIPTVFIFAQANEMQRLALAIETSSVFLSFDIF